MFFDCTRHRKKKPSKMFCPTMLAADLIGDDLRGRHAVPFCFAHSGSGRISKRNAPEKLL
jgi:hypothetical protein